MGSIAALLRRRGGRVVVDGGHSWLTRTEIARRLGRNESVIRLWRDRFRDLLPERRDAQGHYLYPLWAFEEIEVMRDQGRSTREIRERLADLTAGRSAPTGDAQAEDRAFRDFVRAELAEIRRMLQLLLGDRTGRS